jgi:Tfp pilus assembly protein PilF
LSLFIPRALTLLALAGVAFTNAQEVTTLSGDLFTSTGAPSHTYSVELTSLKVNMPVERTESDSAGRFAFSNVAAGSYSIVVKTDSGEVIGIQNVPSIMRSVPVRIQIAEAALAKPVSGTVSVGALQHHAPKKAVQQMSAAIQATEKGDAASAEKYLLVAIAIDPDFSDAHTNLGALYSRQKKLEPAYAEFETALKLGPQGAMQYCNLAVIALAMNRPEEAEKEVRQALLVDSRNPQSNFLLGKMMSNQPERYDEAVKHLKLAAPEIANANVLLATLYAKTGRKQEAIAALENYKLLNPTADRENVQKMISSLR